MKLIPNIISSIRLILAPVVLILLINLEHRLALVIFIAAALSDLLDGYLARKYQLKTKLGVILDPIADKLLIFLCVTYFVVLNQAPWWWLSIIILRDVSLILGILLLKTLAAPVDIFPTFIGKSATAFNMLALVFLMTASFKPILADPFIYPSILLACFFTFFSFLQYTRKWYLFYRKRGEN